MKYECKLCNYVTTISSNYNKHLLTKIHIILTLNNNEKLNKKKFSEKKIKQKNKYNLDEKVYKCDYCNKKFSKEINLKRHISTCYECKKIIDEKNALNMVKTQKSTFLHNFAHFSTSLSTDKETIEKDTTAYECEFCDKIFLREFCLKRHYKTCKEKKRYENEMQKELERKNEEIKDLKEDVKFHKEMNISAGNLMHKQMNATILYLTKTYPNAPPLEAITGLDLQKHFIDQERIKEIEEYTFDEFHDFDEDEETKVKNEKRLETEKDKMRKIEVGKTITYIHYNKMFVPKMVKLICDIYKKNDPDKQSNWVSDVSRKSYYYKKKHETKKTIEKDIEEDIEEDIKEEIEETYEEKKNMQEQIEKDLTTSGWVFDPKGKEFESKTIEPLMSFIIEYAEMYHDSLIERMQKDKSINPIKTAIEIGNISELLRNVREKKYNKEIIGNITPLFHLQKK
jgi:hypothetical protein